MADEGNGTGSSAIWAVALVIIVMVIFGALFYGGVFSNKPTEQKIDIKVPTR